VNEFKDLLHDLANRMEEIANHDYVGMWSDPTFAVAIDLVDGTRCSLWIDGDLEAAYQQIGELLYRVGEFMVQSRVHQKGADLIKTAEED
jgi:hypothetical protein